MAMPAALSGVCLSFSFSLVKELVLFYIQLYALYLLTLNFAPQNRCLGPSSSFHLF